MLANLSFIGAAMDGFCATDGHIQSNHVMYFLQITSKDESVVKGVYLIVIRIRYMGETGTDDPDTSSGTKANKVLMNLI